MARPHVPKFGAWDAKGGNGGTYTAVFDHARAGKGGKLINPNDPAENDALAAQLYGGPLPTQRNNDRSPSRGRQAYDTGRPEPPPRRPQQDRYGDGPSHSGERSSANPYASGAREAGRGAATPAMGRRSRNFSGGDEGSVLAPGTPKARLRTQGGRPEEPTKGGALPKFGDWDVKDPNAGEGFTVIFQKLADEKKEGGPVQIPRLNPDHRLSHDEGHGKRSQYGASKVTKDTKHSRQPGCCTIL
ncbi:RPM1-interacting protein 4 [Physcomitrium patens]|uniref:RIN4 pathogenic type III effector avirulence factor Avr cleavage site domain-containing protein n=1 Tax=Physcomitrium patens TaxID=3218 RepID=A0A2K1L9F9_PHYPA|nr:RPM1-interacting protein 4-like [Physcomitrium patens]PNR62670.1 hypothetical protein PHYPA_001094 [Physcomitrium patens]|eukprot:XP_024382073.1 RPM1-interacting protein 4-like [Physcomitrella patens]